MFRDGAGAVGGPVRVEIVAEDDLVVVWLVGEQDRATAGFIRAALVEAADLLPAVVVVVDLSAASFVDASTVGALVFGHVLLEGQGRRLRVRSPQRHAWTLLKICRLTHLIEPDDRRTGSTALGSWVEVPGGSWVEVPGTERRCVDIREHQGRM